MTQTLYVISDLHLGGDATYSICPLRSQELLAKFLQSLSEEVKLGANLHLIVNGDSVDFLAEEKFQAFTANDDDAKTKLKSIIESTKLVWDGFAQFVRDGGELTFTIGNHDIELALPGPRRLLEETLGSGRVNLLLDGESLHIGDVLITHGNQYDRWNRVDHASLNRFRESCLSDNELEVFDPPAGSRLVHEIMNPIKKDFSFVNLLKPENQAAIPFLGILSPRKLGYIDEFIPLYFDAQTTGIDTAAVAGTCVSIRHPADQAELEFANEVAFQDQDMEAVGAARDWFEAWTECRDKHQRRKQIQRLRRVLDRWLHKYLLTFDTTIESADYLEPATRAAKDHGFSVILYGHTHLAKRIPIPLTNSVYLNTGTWADLMCVPDSILLPDLEAEGERQLTLFANDLRRNCLKRWTSHMHTFARIEMHAGRVGRAEILVWKDDGSREELPTGRISRFLVRADDAVAKGGN